MMPGLRLLSNTVLGTVYSTRRGITAAGPDEAITYQPPGTLAPEGGVWSIRLDGEDAFRFGVTPITLGAGTINEPALIWPNGVKLWGLPGTPAVEIEGYFGVNTPDADTLNAYISGNVQGDTNPRWACWARDTTRNYTGAVFGWAPSGTQNFDTYLGYVSTGLLSMRAASPILRVRSTNNATNGLALTTPGMEVISANANTTTARTIGAFKFLSADAELTTENPKLVAAIAARATETYGADTSGGAALDFHVTPNAPGATNVPVVGMSLQAGGQVLLGTGLTVPTMTGAGVLLANVGAAPSTNPVGGGVLYCESGALKYRGTSGTVTTLGNA